MLTLPATLYPGTSERVRAWAADPEVLGVVWVGSKSRGHGDRYSDDDLEVLLTPRAFARLAPAESYEVLRDPEADPPRLVYDAQLTTLEALQAKASSLRDLDHWPYERAQVLFDRSGAVAQAVAAAARMAPAFRHARILHGALDTHLAAVRAKKAGWRELAVSRAMLVARGAKALSRVVFALEDRWVPLDHWLEPELATLADPFGAAACLREALVEMRYEPLQTGLERLQPRLEQEGYPPAAGLSTFFLEKVHASNAAEREIHGLN